MYRTINIATPGTAQHAEILAVLAALGAHPGPVNIVSDSQYVVKTINAIEIARLKGDPNSTIFQLFTQVQMVIQVHSSSFFYYSYLLHIQVCLAPWPKEIKQ
jgi:ribonuclease HI